MSTSPLLRAAVFITDEPSGEISVQIAVQRADLKNRTPITQEERDKSPSWVAARDVADYLTNPERKDKAVEMFLEHQKQQTATTGQL